MPANLKPAHLRQRRNKASTEAFLGPDLRPAEWPPALPARPGGGAWHENTRAWWSSVWAGVEADQYITSDVHGLLTLAWLVDAYHASPDDIRLAREIRLLDKEFGLSPKSRAVLSHAAAHVASKGE